MNSHAPTELDLLPNKTIYCEYNISEVLDLQDSSNKKKMLRLPITFVVRELAEDP